jgi:hypothetical protein
VGSTRLTNGFSKSQVKLDAMLPLYFTWHNFCRVHSSIRVTPAVEAGIMDHIWTLRQLLPSDREISELTGNRQATYF